MRRSLGFTSLLLVILSCLIPARSLRAADADPVALDEKLLKDQKMAVDGPSLLEFFKRRTLTDDDEKQIRKLIGQLGSEEFDDREKATQQIVARGEAALRFLREALKDADLETRRRAEQSIATIEGQSNSGLLLAAVRVLARAHPEGTSAVLLNYLPNAANEEVRQQVFDALVTAGTPNGKPDAILVDALRSELAIRRMAAVHVLGRLADPEMKSAVLGLLKTDKDPQVRLKAGQSLIAGKHREAVPAIVELLVGTPRDVMAGAEEILWQLAQDKSPRKPAGDETDDLKKKYRDLWLTWWKDNGDKIDLARVMEAPPYLHYTLVPEAHKNRVFECDRDGKIRWEIGNLQYPIDAQILPGGRVLIAELNGNRVAEHTLEGKVLWEKSINGPIACERLANGNTFVGTNHTLHEFTRDGKEVFTYKPENDFFIHSTQRLKNGHIVMISMAGEVREIDSAGTVLTTVKMNQGGNWSGIEGVAGNRFLVANLATVQEINSEGKVLWEAPINGASYASRLSNGNTLIAAHSQNRIVEVDRDGKIVWEQKLDSAPWRVHRR